MANEFITQDWDGVNKQAASLEKPTSEQTQIFLWLSCIYCGTKKRFVVTAALTELINKKTLWISYGSTCERCGRKINVVLMWEKPDKQWEETRKAVEELLAPA